MALSTSRTQLLLSYNERGLYSSRDLHSSAAEIASLALIAGLPLVYILRRRSSSGPFPSRVGNDPELSATEWFAVAVITARENTSGIVICE